MYGHCDACPIPDSPRQVFGTGPTPCRIALLGAGPGKNENLTLRAYSGQAGQELDDTYLPLGGLDRETCFIDNCSKCWDGTDRPVPEKRSLSCARYHLPQLLASLQPQVLVLMGAAACRIADPFPTPDGDHQRLRLDLHRGIPQWGSILGGLWSGWIWPMFEPALGMRNTPKMTELLEDWVNFGAWRRGEWRPPQPEEVEPDYRFARTIDELHSYLDCLPACIAMGLDTENHGPTPFSIQVSHTPHTARMILWRDREVIREFARWVAQSSTDWYLHFAPHDLDWCDKMGVSLPRWFDTQQDAYHLCSLPQGLKPLTYRLWGMVMHGWEDTVLPASRAALCDWLKRGVEIAREELAEVEVTYYKRGVCSLCWHAHLAKPCGRGHCTCMNIPAKTSTIAMQKSEDVAGALEKIFKHIVKYTESTIDAEKPYDPWKAISKMKEIGLSGDIAEGWEWELVEKRLGPQPILGIGNCDLSEALAYSCSDADWTLQDGLEMERRMHSDRWQVDPVDYDAPVIDGAPRHPRSASLTAS